MRRRRKRSIATHPTTDRFGPRDMNKHRNALNMEKGYLWAGPSQAELTSAEGIEELHPRRKRRDG